MNLMVVSGVCPASWAALPSAGGAGAVSVCTQGGNGGHSWFLTRGTRRASEPAALRVCAS